MPVMSAHPIQTRVQDNINSVQNQAAGTEPHSPTQHSCTTTDQPSRTTSSRLYAHPATSFQLQQSPIRDRDTLPFTRQQPALRPYSGHISHFKHHSWQSAVPRDNIMPSVRSWRQYRRLGRRTRLISRTHAPPLNHQRRNRADRSRKNLGQGEELDKCGYRSHSGLP